MVLVFNVGCFEIYKKVFCVSLFSRVFKALPTLKVLDGVAKLPSDSGFVEDDTQADASRCTILWTVDTILTCLRTWVLEWDLTLITSIKLFSQADSII